MEDVGIVPEHIQTGQNSLKMCLGKTVETTEVHAALSWLFNNDNESVDQELKSDKHFTSLEISFANPDLYIIRTCSMDEQQCNQVCTATRTSGFAGIAYSPEELKEQWKKSFQSPIDTTLF